MPTQQVRDDYARWLASPPITGMLVETMEISGLAMGGQTLRLVNRSDAPLLATDEKGVQSVWHPLAFTISKPALRNSSELLMNARIDALDGQIYGLLGHMKADDLLHPLQVAIRLFIDPTMLDRPVYRAPLLLRVETAKIAMDVVELTLVGGRLPNKSAGTRYTLDRFVGVRPF